jgi:cell division protein FtsB
MASHHITVNYLVIGILVLVLACGGVGAYFGLKGYNKLMDRAEASEKLTVQYEQTWKESQQQVKAANDLYEKELTQHAADRAADAQRLLDLTKAMQALNANADKHISDVTQPGKSAEQAFIDLKDAYKTTALGGTLALSVTADKDSGEKLMSFPVPTVQQFTATKIDRDRLFDNVTNLNQQVGVKQKDLDSLGLDFKNLQTTYNTLKESDNQLQSANTQCLDTVKQYKKVAVKTKWQKIWAGTKTGLMVGVSLLAGYELGKRL